MISKNAFKTINLINPDKKDYKHIGTSDDIEDFNPYIPYEIVSNKSGNMYGIDFYENKPTKVTGWLANRIVNDSEGMIRFYNREALIAEIKAEEKIKADKEAMKAEIKAEILAESKSKPKIKGTNK